MDGRRRQGRRWPGRPGLRRRPAPGPRRPGDTQCRNVRMPGPERGKWQFLEEATLESSLQGAWPEGRRERVPDLHPHVPGGHERCAIRSGSSCGREMASKPGGERAPLKFPSAERHRPLLFPSPVPFHAPLESPNRKGGERACRWGQRQPAQRQGGRSGLPTPHPLRAGDGGAIADPEQRLSTQVTGQGQAAHGDMHHGASLPNHKALPTREGAWEVTGTEELRKSLQPQTPEAGNEVRRGQASQQGR